jgi:hypothetical protein
MGHRGRVQFTSVVIAPADQVAEGDRLLATHAAWMEGTHHRSGDNALLSYNVAKGPELSDPSNPESEPTGNTCYIVTEVYETEAGVADHFAQADATWKEYPEMGKWLERCKQVTMVPVAQIVYSLW